MIITTIVASASNELTAAAQSCVNFIVDQRNTTLYPEQCHHMGHG